MQRKSHRCDSLYTPINHARLENAFEQTGNCKPRKAISSDWGCENKQRFEQRKESYKKGKQK